jgi:hypothetical protein
MSESIYVEHGPDGYELILPRKIFPDTDGMYKPTQPAGTWLATLYYMGIVPILIGNYVNDKLETDLPHIVLPLALDDWGNDARNAIVSLLGETLAAMIYEVPGNPTYLEVTSEAFDRIKLYLLLYVTSQLRSLPNAC